MDLNDELGRITHVFSDKTGTLTMNYMEFRCACVSCACGWVVGWFGGAPPARAPRRRKLAIRDVAYGLGTTEIGASRLRREGRRGTVGGPPGGGAAPPLVAPHVNFTDGSESHSGATLAAALARGDAGGGGDAHAAAAHAFMMHLALNHTVVVEATPPAAAAHPRLSASSPDEEAFVCAAAAFGFEFRGREGEAVTITARGRALRYRVLHILAYSQARRRTLL